MICREIRERIERQSSLTGPQLDAEVERAIQAAIQEGCAQKCSQGDSCLRKQGCIYE